MRILSPSMHLALVGVLSLNGCGPKQITASFDTLALGSSAIEITGNGRIPLLRGIDTDSRAAVLAQGEDKEKPDEFLLNVEMLTGSNTCTKPVAMALGGSIEELTLARHRDGGLFDSTTKVTQEVALIPELRMKGEDGEVVIKDWRCRIHGENNTLAVHLLGGMAAAKLVNDGVYVFGTAEQTAEIMALVGEAKPAKVMPASFYQVAGAWQTRQTQDLLVEAEVFGKTHWAYLSDTRLPNAVSKAILPADVAVSQYARFERSRSAVSLQGAALPGERAFIHRAGPLSQVVGAADAEDVAVDVALGALDLARVSIAVDPAKAQVALRVEDSASWTDPSQKFIDDAKKAFEGDDKKSALLTPAEVDPTTLVAQVIEECVEEQIVDYSFTTRDGVRAFGASALGVERVDCESLTGATNAEESAGEAEADSESKTDPKEAGKRADYADVLYKHGRFDEAMSLYEEALDYAGDDCSYYQDTSKKLLAAGKTEAALTAAKKSSELYEPWAAQSLEVRLAVKAGDTEDLPEGSITNAQSHDCHVTRGYEAMAYLVKGSHSDVDGVFSAHMDLDEGVAMAKALSLMQRGEGQAARGPALQALDVGARGTVIGHLVHGAAASYSGSDQLIQANVDRILTLPALGTADYLVAAQVASTASAPDARWNFAQRVIAERPEDAGAWTVFALEALRRGDESALARAKSAASADALGRVDALAGQAWAVCDAAALFAAVGDAEKAQSLVETASSLGRPRTSCGAVGVVQAAASGDAGALAGALSNFAVRFPAHPLGTLQMVSAISQPAAE